MFTSEQAFLKFEEEQVLLRNGTVMELKNPLIPVSQNWKKYFQMNLFLACVPEIHLLYLESNL